MTPSERVTRLKSESRVRAELPSSALRPPRGRRGRFPRSRRSPATPPSAPDSAPDAALQGCSGDLPLTPSCRGGGAGRPVPEQVQGTGTFVTGPRTNTECQSGERAACHL